MKNKDKKNNIKETIDKKKKATNEGKDYYEKVNEQEENENENEKK